MVRVLLIVLVGNPRKYCFTVKTPVAVLPDFDAVSLGTCHALLYIKCVTDAAVQMAVDPS